jgi:hypothetical protein
MIPDVCIDRHEAGISDQTIRIISRIVLQVRMTKDL